MYFIPRNNAFYHYIAHTNTMRRYCATLLLFVGFGLICFYGMYAPLNAHIMLYEMERERLQKQYEDIQLMRKSAKELSMVIDGKKRNVNEYVFADDKREENCNKQMQFVFDIITQQGLMLNSYGSCKEIDKKWYVKDVAHCQIVGSMEKLLAFLKVIKDSSQMIKLSHITVVRAKDNLFQLDCDIAVITVKSIS